MRRLFLIMALIFFGVTPSLAGPSDWRDSVVTIYIADPLKGEVYQGSGFAIRDDTVITNLHVVYHKYKDKGAPLLITSEKGAFFGELLYYDPLRDIALLSVKAHPFVALHVESKIMVMKGEEVYVIGNPRGKGLRMERGRVLNILGPDELIQTDAPTEEGSSGGPLVNSKGRVIGIMTFKLKGEDSAFALSARHILSILEKIERRGRGKT